MVWSHHQGFLTCIRKFMAVSPGKKGRNNQVTMKRGYTEYKGQFFLKSFYTIQLMKFLLFLHTLTQKWYFLIGPVPLIQSVTCTLYIKMKMSHPNENADSIINQVIQSHFQEFPNQVITSRTIIIIHLSSCI